jgi:hypothetical protein
MLTREEQTSLISLSWHWEGSYTFQVVDGVWQATPIDDPAGMLTADDPEELRHLVRMDHARRRVGKDLSL